MVSFIKRENLLLLEYSSGNGVKWIFDMFNKGHSCRIKRTFTFHEEDVFYDKDEIDNEYQVLFKIGKLDGDYYKINGEVLEIDVNVYIDRNVDLNKEMFIAYQYISIFKRISMIVKEDIRIGNGETDLPITVFKELIGYCGCFLPPMQSFLPPIADKCTTLCEIIYQNIKKR